MAKLKNLVSLLEEEIEVQRKRPIKKGDEDYRNGIIDGIVLSLKLIENTKEK